MDAACPAQHGPRRPPLLQQQRIRFHLRQAPEIAREHAAAKRIAYGRHDHALMMRHVAFDNAVFTSFRQPFYTIVHRLVKPQRRQKSHRRHVLKVFNRFSGHNRKRQRRRIRRNHARKRLRAQRQAGQAKGMVLIGKLRVKRIISAFGDAPGPAGKRRQLRKRRALCALIEQRRARALQKERRQ